jgi:hypothetical protein
MLFTAEVSGHPDDPQLPMIKAQNAYESVNYKIFGLSSLDWRQQVLVSRGSAIASSRSVSM